MKMPKTDRTSRSGDDFAAEISRVAPSLKGFAKVLCRNEDAAADLTQETLAKAWQARDSFVPGTNLRAWLYTIMRNQFRSEIRRAWRQVSWDAAVAEQIPGPAAEQTWVLELKDTARAIKSLSGRQREALLLCGVGGLSSEDAAAVMGCARTAAKSRVSRARQAMLSMLDGKAPLTPTREKQDITERLAEDLVAITHRVPTNSPNHPHFDVHAQVV